MGRLAGFKLASFDVDSIRDATQFVLSFAIQHVVSQVPCVGGLPSQLGGCPRRHRVRSYSAQTSNPQHGSTEVAIDRPSGWREVPLSGGAPAKSSCKGQFGNTDESRQSDITWLKDASLAGVQ